MYKDQNLVQELAIELEKKHCVLHVSDEIKHFEQKAPTQVISRLSQYRKAYVMGMPTMSAGRHCRTASVLNAIILEH